jgi:phosphoglycolate phosphatase-like HAD superfamily hydrolase
MNLQNMKLIILDFDGVIIDSEKLKRDAWITLLEVTDDPVGFSWGSHDPRVLIQNAYETWIDGAQRGSRYEIIDHMMYEAGYPKSDSSVSWYAKKYNDIVQRGITETGVSFHTRKTLKSLSQHYPLYLNSATPEKNLKESLDVLTIAEYFKEALGKTTLKRENSKVENIQHAAQSEHATMDETLFVGDSESDFDAARECGCQFIRYKEFSFGKEKMWHPEASHSISNLDELLTS